MIRMTRRGIMTGAMVGLLSGCTGSLKQEIVHLGDRNRSITAQLNLARQDLDAVRGEQQRCDTLLADARLDNDTLRGEGEGEDLEDACM